MKSAFENVINNIPGQGRLIVRAIAIVIAASVMTGCGSVSTCEEPEFYESAVGGKRIVTPDDLDAPQAFKEMIIPEASPRPPREPGSGCLDRPPVTRVE